MKGGASPPVGCHRERLGHGLMSAVDLCPACGIVHLTIGSLTLRLDVGACHDLSDTLAASLDELNRRLEAAAVRRPRLEVLDGGGTGRETPALAD